MTGWSILERLARSLAGAEGLSRRALLTAPLAPADARPPLAVTPVAAAAATTAIVTSAALTPAVAAAHPPDTDHHPPTPPAQPDLHAIHMALASADSSIHGEVVVLFHAMEKLNQDGTFTTAANQAIMRLRTKVQEVHARVTAVSVDSAVRDHTLALVADLDAMLADFQKLSTVTKPAAAAPLAEAIKKLETRLRASYSEIQGPLNLPKEPEPLP